MKTIFSSPLSKYIFLVVFVLCLSPIETHAKTKPSHKTIFNSDIVYVYNNTDKQVVISKNISKQSSIASITKLLTGIVLMDADQDLNELIEITSDDIDNLKHSHSRLRIGAKIPRYHLMHIMLMSSDNRAANALARHYPCGLSCFKTIMNSYAFVLGMDQSYFEEPTGLAKTNISSSTDLLKLMDKARTYPMLSLITSTPFSLFYSIEAGEIFRNTNKFIDLNNVIISKTGYIAEAGYCIVMIASINNKEYSIVTLNAKSKSRRFKDLTKIFKTIGKR